MSHLEDDHGLPMTPSRLRPPTKSIQPFSTTLLSRSSAAASSQNNPNLANVSLSTLDKDDWIIGESQSKRRRVSIEVKAMPEPTRSQASAAANRKPIGSSVTAATRPPPSRPAIPPANKTAARKPSMPTSKLAPASSAVPRSFAAQPRASALPTRLSGLTSKETSTFSTDTLPSAFGEGGKRKSPPWDAKDRFQDMEELNALLRQQVEASSQLASTMSQQQLQNENRVKQLECVRQGLEAKVHIKEQENTDMGRELTGLRELLQSERRKHESEVSELGESFKSKLSNADLRYDNMKRAYELTTQDLQLCQEENGKLKSSLSTQAASILMLESDQRALRRSIETMEKQESELREQLSKLGALLVQAQAKIADLDEQLTLGEATRKKLHNEIQELKGNIRVFCRVRPLLKDEELAGEETESSLGFSCQLAYPKNPLAQSESIEILQTLEPASGSTKPIVKSYPFTFDKVFQPTTTQTQVFEEISQLVQSALDGYRVCIFAYGQTGSGKTFTMEGPTTAQGKMLVDDPVAMGMIPRAVMQIFSTAEALSSKGWQFEMEASFLEIYNETLRDLLSPSTSLDQKLEIRHLPNTSKTIVTDLTTGKLRPDAGARCNLLFFRQLVSVCSMGEIFELLKKASHHRAVGETQCNERSSRSHSVFMLKLSGANALTMEKCKGQLNLIDLAGSERLSQSGATGDRLKETQAINKSLSALGDVVVALANKEPHVPFRNSKLTYLLQNSLGGNCKTLMFVNVSPSQSHIQETLCSLRFAAKVNACQIGTARKAVVAK